MSPSTPTPVAARGSFAAAIGRARGQGRLVLQPRMGMARPAAMRAGLEAVKGAHTPGAAVVGTITVDSFTRTGDLRAARKAVFAGDDLNGYPIAAHPASTTRAVLDAVWDAQFPVQVRHGSADPRPIVEAILDVGMDATEGGPVSYCLPYSRMPLARATDHWRAATESLAHLRGYGMTPHVESFGGCMLGQLCPPEMLVALTVLEGMFFRQQGIPSVSLSLTQQTDFQQDLEALAALTHLAGEYLSDIDWHIVLYAYMGVFPSTTDGARRLMRDAIHLATAGGAHRVIVKTPSEAHRIPTVLDNVAAIEDAAQHVSCRCRHPQARPGPAKEEGSILAASRALIEATLEHADDVGTAMIRAFGHGHLDVPFCLHPDNTGRARAALTAEGRITWSQIGNLPLPPPADRLPAHGTTASASSNLLGALDTVRRRYDHNPALLEGELR